MNRSAVSFVKYLDFCSFRLCMHLVFFMSIPDQIEMTTWKFYVTTFNQVSKNSSVSILLFYNQNQNIATQVFPQYFQNCFDQVNSFFTNIFLVDEYIQRISSVIEKTNIKKKQIRRKKKQSFYKGINCFTLLLKMRMNCKVICITTSEEINFLEKKYCKRQTHLLKQQYLKTQVTRCYFLFKKLRKIIKS